MLKLTHFAYLFPEKTTSYLKDFGQVDAQYVETHLTRECESRLHRFGLIVLIGEQGSGKTSTAVHIMRKLQYDNWTKHKITSWVELLAFEFKEKTLIYADNLFDGFMYQQEVDRWWETLCYFYFKLIKPVDKVRLIITAKQDVVDKACAFNEIDIWTLERTCFIRVDAFPLSDEEKINILQNQISLAKTLKKIDVHEAVTEKLRADIRKKSCPLGFPLCAHLYAFEKDSIHRNSSIFDVPRHYVEIQIQREIENDKSPAGVKTLFLILLYYFNPETKNTPKQLNLEFREECKEFLEAQCNRKLKEMMEPLVYNNLYETANRLEGTVLIKHQSVCEFKHQIYLQAVSHYFFKKHFDAVVEYFPMNILRTYEMHDLSKEQIIRIAERLSKEIENRIVSETLSCKMLKEPVLEQAFCDSLHSNNSTLAKLLEANDSTSGFEFPIVFWASKYNLTRLSSTVWKLADNKDKDRYFYLARLGECCAIKESYIKEAVKIGGGQHSVLTFRSSEGETILHLILSSDRSDNEAYHHLNKILKESNNEFLQLEKPLLESVFKQTKRSRLQCLLLLFDKLSKSEIIDTGNKTKLEVASTTMDTLQKLELLCRISILVVHGVRFTKNTAEAMFGDRNYFSTIDTQLQCDMAKRIQGCVMDLSERPDIAHKDILIQREMAEPLTKAIRDAIGIFAVKEANDQK